MMILTLIGFVIVLVALFFPWLDFSQSTKAKQLRVAIVLFTTTGYSWKGSYKKAKDTVK